MEIPLLSDIVVVLGLSVFVVLLFLRLNVPTILGFLITGVVAGPHGLGLVSASHEIEILAEIGVIMLLFIIGMEFSLKTLVSIRKAVLLGGSAQVFITIAVVALGTYLWGLNLSNALFMGFLFAMSSTAIVLKLLQEKGEVSSPHGRIILAILIYQDIIVVPLMLLAPLMSGSNENLWMSLLLMAGKGLLVVGLVYIGARYVVPKLLFQVAKTKSKELFILSIVVICFAVAWLTSNMGLSLALGAFLAGLIISESEYSQMATSNILPFREIFSSFFFISIGMLLDLEFFVEHFPIVLLLAVITFLLKGSVAAVAAKLLNYPLRTSLLVGLSLFQVGEFAFILSETGINSGLLSPMAYQYFLSVSITTMALTPFVLAYAHPITNLLLYPLNLQVAEPGDIEQATVADHEHELNDHIVIIGFGVNGKNVAKSARNAQIPYVVLELNAQTVHQERRNGEPIYYGDAVHPHILHMVAIHKARVAVIAISDPEATKRIVATIRTLTEKVYIIVRTRFVNEIEEIIRLGANEAIPEEFETSIEIFTRVLSKYLVPKDEIEDFVNSIRADNYDMFRSLPSLNEAFKIASLELPDFEIATLRVQQSDNDIIGKTLEEANVRQLYKVTLVAIRRGSSLLDEMSAETRIQQDDLLYVIGKPHDVAAFHKMLKTI